MSFLYGNNVAKSGLGRMTEGIPQYAGVVVYSMTDVPLGKHASASYAWSRVACFGRSAGVPLWLSMCKRTVNPPQ